MLRGSFWPTNCVSKPGGEGAGVLVEVTRFPGLGLESGQAWSTGNCRAGEAVSGDGWPGPPRETFLLESQRLLGTGLAQSGYGRGRAPWRRRRGPGGPGCRGCCAKLVLGAGAGCRQEAGLAQSRLAHLGLSPGPCGRAAGSAGSAYPRAHSSWPPGAFQLGGGGGGFEGLWAGGSWRKWSRLLAW